MPKVIKDSNKFYVMTLSASFHLKQTIRFQKSHIFESLKFKIARQMRNLGKNFLFLVVICLTLTQTSFAQTEFESVFVIQKYVNDGENLTKDAIDNQNFIRMYGFPNDESIYLSIEAVEDTSMVYGYFDELEFEEFPANGEQVAYEKMSFKWVFHDDFAGDDSVWPGELFMYHQPNMDVYTLKFITIDGKLVQFEGYIEGTQNFGEEE
jgi:hypothetical protein